MLGLHAEEGRAVRERQQPRRGRRSGVGRYGQTLTMANGFANGLDVRKRSAQKNSSHCGLRNWNNGVPFAETRGKQMAGGGTRRGHDDVE